MGVIQRQTLKNNVIAFAAVGVGAFSRLFIYPRDPTLNGYSDAIINAALLLVPFLTLGTTSVMVRFLGYLEGADERANAGQLLARALVVATGAIGALGIFNYAAADWLNVVLPRGALHISRWAIIGVAAALVYGGIITAHLLSFKRIAVPVIFNNLTVKIGTALLFYLTVEAYVAPGVYETGLVIVYTLAGLGVLVYALRLQVVKLSWGRLALPATHRRQLYGLATFSVFSALGSRLTMYIDTLSIDAILGSYDTGIYSLAKFIVGVVAIPYIAINGITSPIVAEAWRTRDMGQLDFLYKESSIVLFAFGGLIVTGAVVCLPPLYSIVPNLEQYRAGYIAVLFLGGGQLVDLATSINGNLIGMTDYYRWNVVFILALGLFNAVLNYIFIALLGYGITGAAISTAISLVIYNLVKVAFIYWKMGLQPFTGQHLRLLIVLVALGGGALAMPAQLVAPLPLFVLRGSFVTLAFLALLYFTPTVPALRRVLRQGVGAAFK